MTPTQRSFGPWHVVVAVTVVVIAVIVVFNFGDQDGVRPASTSVLAAPAIGDASAPITIYEFADFQCIYCAIFARDTKPQLVEEFVETGIVRFEWRHFPIFGEPSVLASHASACAHEQGAFWEYHDALFADEEQNKTLAGHIDLAARLGLDTTAFRTCIDEERYADQIESNYWEGRGRGVTGTPAFIVNGSLLAGAHPIETWRQVIDLILEDAAAEN